MAKPERYQLPFDFRRRLDRSLVYYELGFVGQQNPGDTSRLVCQRREKALPPSTVYLLAAPSTPDEVIEDIEQQIEAGETLTVSHVQRIISEAKKRKTRSKDDVNTVEGTVISSRVVDADVDTTEVANRLENVLTQVFDLLSEQEGDDWSALFHNSKLTRFRNEIYQFREELRSKLMAR